jgi:hypothetical protein
MPQHLALDKDREAPIHGSTLGCVPPLHDAFVSLATAPYWPMGHS